MTRSPLAPESPSRELDGADLDAAGSLGQALAELAADRDDAARLRRRIAYRDGSAALSAEVVATRHVLHGQGPWLLLIVRDADVTPADPVTDEESEWLQRAAIASGADHWHGDLASGRVWYEERLKTLPRASDSAPRWRVPITPVVRGRDARSVRTFAATAIPRLAARTPVLAVG